MQQSSISLVLHVNKFIKLLSAWLYSHHNCKFKPSLNDSHFLRLICPFEVRLTALYSTNKELQYALVCITTYGLYLFSFSSYSLRTVHLGKYLVQLLRGLSSVNMRDGMRVESHEFEPSQFTPFLIQFFTNFNNYRRAELRADSRIIKFHLKSCSRWQLSHWGKIWRKFSTC